ncbi:MAG: CRTAC1 family protein [Chloroflexota bacterium]
MSNRVFHQLSLCFVAFMLTACLAIPIPVTLLDGAESDASDTPKVLADVTVSILPLAPKSECEERFVEHTLPFATGIRIREINTYESNGAGVAINDLDNDGDLDLLFASIDNESEILWNEGSLSFRAESLPIRFTRGVQIVDVDGDLALDVVFTLRGVAPPSYWRNLGDGELVQDILPGVKSLAYSMAWADLNGDSALDLVTGSYNIDLIPRGIDFPAEDERAGVIVYTQNKGQFDALRLTGESEALSIAVLDLNDDGHQDLWIANDFDLTDGFWLNQSDGWLATLPFDEISHSTMSIDWGDLSNDGSTALFTTDMMPYDDAPETVAAWQPVMEAMMTQHVPIEGDPQLMENVLQVREDEWQNQAAQRGIVATGWSWAGRLGDLDNDGLLDLYVVNGMIAQNMFGHLPNGELVEENQVFRNRGDGTFEPMPRWGLGSTASGRGMVMADLDSDGDLDIVINNLRASAQLFENRLCGGKGLLVDLLWPDSGNSRAIGAEIVLETSIGRLTRDVRASGGYLSGDPARVHFGLPKDAEIRQLNVLWPDGAKSSVEQVSQQMLYTLTRE